MGNLSYFGSDKCFLKNKFAGCGESRTLKKEVANQAATKEDKFGHLRLMIVYRNNDKMLADVLGATEGITIFFYHHSVRYKYRGRLRMQNIFTSLDHLRSLKPDELPLKTLSTVKDLNTFLQSTDKAVLLLEFCGWTPRLLRKNKDDEIDSALHVQCASDKGGLNHLTICVPFILVSLSVLIIGVQPGFSPFKQLFLNNC